MDYMDDDDDSFPSFGETRAADTPGDRPPAGSHGSFVQTPASGRTAGMPRAKPPERPTRAVQNSAPPVGGATGQFCGTCGARINGAEAFCGQCGTPVGQSGDEYTSAALGISNSAPSRYHVGASGPWTPAQADELTEAYVPASAYGQSRPGLPYAQGGFGSGPYAPTPAASNTRTTRIVIGVVCLVGSLASAVVAIIIAVLR